MIRINPKHVALKEYIEELLNKHEIVSVNKWTITIGFETPMIKKTEARFFDHGFHYHILTQKCDDSTLSNESDQQLLERIVIHLSVPGWKSESLEDIAIPTIKRTFGDNIFILTPNHFDKLCGPKSSGGFQDKLKMQLRQQINTSKYDLSLCFITRLEKTIVKDMDDQTELQHVEAKSRHVCNLPDIADRLSNLRRLFLSPSIYNGFTKVLDPKHNLPEYFVSLDMSGSQLFAYKIPICNEYERGQESMTKSMCIVFSQKDRLTITFAICISDEVERTIATLILQQMVQSGGSSALFSNLKDAPYWEYRRASDPPKEFVLFNQAVYSPKPSTQSCSKGAANRVSSSSKVKLKAHTCNQMSSHEQPSISCYDRSHTCAGFVSFSFESRHIIDENRRESAIDCILMFVPYLNHHIRCSKSHMSQRTIKYGVAFSVLKMDPIENKSSDDQ